MARGESHGLGFGNGSIIDLGGGVIEYRQTGELLPVQSGTQRARLRC
jgi:hypothetical protein